MEILILSVFNLMFLKFLVVHVFGKSFDNESLEYGCFRGAAVIVVGTIFTGCIDVCLEKRGKVLD